MATPKKPAKIKKATGVMPTKPKLKGLTSQVFYKLKPRVCFWWNWQPSLNFFEGHLIDYNPSVPAAGGPQPPPCVYYMYSASPLVLIGAMRDAVPRRSGLDKQTMINLLEFWFGVDPQRDYAGDLDNFLAQLDKYKLLEITSNQGKLPLAMKYLFTVLPYAKPEIVLHGEPAPDPGTIPPTPSARCCW